MDKLGLSHTYRHILIGLYLLRINLVLCNCFGRCYDPVSQILLSLVLLEQNSCQIRWRFCLSKNGRIWPSRQWWWETSCLPKSSYNWPLGAGTWKWNYDAYINCRKKRMTGYGIFWKALCFLASFFSKLTPCFSNNLIYRSIKQLWKWNSATKSSPTRFLSKNCLIFYSDSTYLLLNVLQWQNN